MHRCARRLTALTASLVASVVLVSTTAAQSSAAGQRVVIEQKLELGSATGAFVLRILEPGALRRASGSFTHRAGGTLRVAIRDGQGVAIHVLVTEFRGKRGMFALRQRLETIAAGNTFMASTGTWRVVLGTGVYAGLTGHGRLGAVITSDGLALTQLEGFLRRDGT